DPETRFPPALGQPDIPSWPRQSLALLKGTKLGQLRFTPPTQRAVRFEEEFDAFVYVGQPEEMTTSRIARTRCQDAQYMEMRLARLALLKPPAGAMVVPADLLRKSCADQ